MEKFSKATSEFGKALKDIKEDVSEANEDSSMLPRIVRAAKLFSKPKNIPNAIIAYNLTKESSLKLHEETPALDVHDFLMKHYKTEWIDWTPETIRKTLLNGVANDILENKIQALALCLSTDTPWLEWHIFENVGKAFNHEVPDFDMVQPLSADECAVTMEVMKNLRDEDWSQEVLIYVATCCYTDQMVYLPPELEISLAQQCLDKFTYYPDLKDSVRPIWNKIKSSLQLMDLDIKDEDPVQVQVSKLVMMTQYVLESF